MYKMSEKEMFDDGALAKYVDDAGETSSFVIVVGDDCVELTPEQFAQLSKAINELR